MWSSKVFRSPSEIRRTRGLRGNIHYHLLSSLTMKALSERGEAGDRRHRTKKVLPGPDHWNKQAMGLAGVAIEAEAHWLRSEALPLSSTFGAITISLSA